MKSKLPEFLRKKFPRAKYSLHSIPDDWDVWTLRKVRIYRDITETRVEWCVDLNDKQDNDFFPTPEEAYAEAIASLLISGGK